MKDIVRNYIAQNHLLQADLPVIVALSGGADSVALMTLLSELKYNIIALHCNFHLRGNESDRDEQFVIHLCKERGIRLYIKHFDTREYSQKKGISIEMAARELRYEWFNQMQQEMKAQCIAVAHHKDDQAETILLNLIRGTGMRGLTGIKPKRDNIVRPLLCVSRQDIEQYLKQKGQSFVTDSTNMEREATRNILRLDIIPQLKAINPRITDSLAETCRIMQGSLNIYIKGIEAEFQRLAISQTTFPLAVLKDESNASTLLHEWLEGKGFTSTQEKEVMLSAQSEPGKVWESATHRLLRDRETLILKERNEESAQITIQQEIVTEIGETGCGIAYLDADLVTQPVTLRQVRQGDSFVPFGMKGRRLVSDFLTDLKLNRFQKEEQQVAMCGEDIVWVVGLRSDNRYRVTDKTKHILKLTIQQ